MLISFSMLEMPPKCIFAHIIKKHDTSATDPMWGN